MAKLPILMYHKVDPLKSSGLTISVEKLEAQFRYLKEIGYTSYHFSELSRLNQFNRKKNVVITFDDGYVSQLDHAYPLLKKYGLKAVFFIPLKYVGQEDYWNEETHPIMDAAALQSLDPTVVELGFHSYAHRPYDTLSPAEVEEDTQQAFKTADVKSLPLGPILAYPYGKFPRKEPQKTTFFKQLRDSGFESGLRIGNGINSFPFKNPYEINRIDVKGEFNLNTFKRRLKYGKWF